MPATADQIQRWADEHVRPRCEQIRALLNAITDDKNSISDVYEALTTGDQQNWTDARTDAPPHLATASDVLAFNTFITNLKTAIEADDQLPVIQSLCVRAEG